MNIFLNGRPAEITLDTEKNLGDIMTGIERWISPSGNRIQKISVNGREVPEDSVTEAFRLEIRDIEKLEIHVGAWRELAAEALALLRETCVLYRDSPFEERARITAGWNNSSASRFLSTDISDLYNLAKLAFSGEGLSAADFITLVDERLRETAGPWEETQNLESQVNAVSLRMEELPLDMQTGKDARAAETIQFFSQTGEKLFRLFFIRKSEGLDMETFVIAELPAKVFIEEFNNALRELSEAYKSQDTVLAGDIAEYELAPRLLQFYSALKNIPKAPSYI